MKTTTGLIIIVTLVGCKEATAKYDREVDRSADSVALATLIVERETAMVERDIDTAITQFTDDATWINSQGYYFQGRESILEFHKMLAGRDGVDYYYEAGEPRIRFIDDRNALAYYSWKMFWYDREDPADTTFREVGLMTLSATRINSTWKWTAVTNQHTPWFYETIDVVTID